MTSLHVENSKYGDVNDLFKSFAYFCEQLDKLGLPIYEPCPISNCKNMKVAMDRILSILNHAIDPQEQFRLLHELDLNNTGAWYAATYDDYFLVTKDMKLDDAHVVDDSFAAKLATPDGIKKVLAATTSIDDATVEFYRYIGNQSYIAKYNQYKKILEHLKSKIETLPLIEQKAVIGLLAIASTGERGMLTADLNNTNALIETLENLDPTKREAILTTCLTVCPDAKPSLIELPLLLKYCEYLAKQENPVDIRATIQANITLFGDTFYQALVNSQQKKAEQHRLELKDFRAISEAIRTKAQANAIDKTIANKLFMTLSKIDGDNFAAKPLHQLLTIISIPENAAKLSTILSVLSTISLKDSTKLPNIIDLSTVIEHLTTQDNPSEQLVRNTLMQQTPGCKFVFSGKETDLGSIEEHLAEIKQYLMQESPKPISSQFLDDDFKDADTLLRKLKAIEESVSIPSFVLTPIKQKVRTMLLATHERNIEEVITRIIANPEGIEPTAQQNKLITRLNVLFKSKLKNPDNPCNDFTDIMVLHGQCSDSQQAIDQLATLMTSIYKKNKGELAKMIAIMEACEGTSNIAIKDLVKIITIMVAEANRPPQKPFPNSILQTILQHPELNPTIDYIKLANALKNTLQSSLPVDVQKELLNISIDLLNSKQTIGVDNILKNITTAIQKHPAMQKELINLYKNALKDISVDVTKLNELTQHLLELASDNNKKQTIKTFLAEFAATPKNLQEVLEKINTVAAAKTIDACLLLELISRSMSAFNTFETVKPPFEYAIHNTP